MKKIVKNFLNFINNWLNPLWIFIYFYKYFTYSKIIKTAFIEDETLKVLKDFKNDSGVELRIDWLGRIYTVINIEPELFMDEGISQLVVLEKIKEIDIILTKIRLSDIVTLTLYREMSKVDNAYYYLIIISPNLEFLTKFDIVFEIVKISLFSYLIYSLF
jgi:hypothetical protein